MMKSNEKIKMTVFGKERELDICLVGDNAPDYDLVTNDLKVVDLTEEEEKLLNWIKSVDFESCKEKIVRYINYLNDVVGEDNNGNYDLSNDETFMPVTILINVSEELMDDDTAEVALFGESCYAEDGIMIAFKNGKYFGISGFDDCMNYFEDENFTS